MSYENFTTYTETDPGSKLTISASRVTFTDAKRSDGTASVLYDKGAGHFDGDFEHLFSAIVTECPSDSAFFLWRLANATKFCGFVAAGDTVKYVLYEYNAIYYSDFYEIAAWGTQIYPKPKRVESVGTYGTLYVYIYSDASRTSLLDTLSLALHSKEDYDDIYAFYLGSSASTGDNSGYVENLDLQESSSYSESASIIVGDAVSASRSAGFPKSSSTIIGALVAATRAVAYDRTASITTGIVNSASKLAAYIRSAINYIGIVVSASEKHTNEYYESAAIEVGNLVSATKAVSFIRSASNLIGNLVSASRRFTSTRASSTILGVSLSASRLINVYKSSVAIGGIIPSASRVASYTRTASNTIGDSVSASRLFNSIRQSAIIIGDYVSASMSHGKTIASSIISGISASASRLIGYIRSSSSEIGVNNQALKYASYNRPSSIISSVTTTASKVFATAKSAAIEVGQRLIKTSSIDSGPGANYFYASTGAGYTRLCATNPCNASGTLDTVKFYFQTDATGVKVGTFFHVSGNTYTCRDSATIGFVAGGSQQTFSSINLDCQTGDILGVYYDTGSICLADDGSASFIKGGDKVVIGNTTLYDGGYSGVAIYATGQTAPIDGATRLVSYNRSAENEIGESSTASKSSTFTRTSSIIEGISVSVSRVFSSIRNAAVEVGAKISASKMISYIRQSSVGSGVVISASKAISIVRNSSIISGIVVTATAGKSYWRNASIIVGAAVSASRSFNFVRNAAVVIGIVATAMIFIPAIGLKVLTLVRTEKIASLARKYYSILLNREDKEL